MHDVGGLLMWLVIGSTFCVATWERRPMDSDITNFDDLEGWTVADRLAADREGWNIWDCDGSLRGRFQLCKCDGQDAFDCDIRVWLFLWARAEEGSRLHLRALRFISRNNPDEYGRIVRRVAALLKVDECSQIGSNSIA